MKILVTAKRVTDPDTRIVLKKDLSGVDWDAMEYKMNPFCEIAVEGALQIKEALDDDDIEVEIVAVAIGDEEATKEVRTAMAMGADRGILVECAEEDLDSDAVARMLVKIAEEEEPDLILLGKQAVDGDNNQVGQLVAEYLGWPQATFAYKIDMDGEAGATVLREVDGGVETIKLSFPAVITTDLRLNEPRYPSLPGIMKAKRKPLKTMEPDDLDVELDLKVETVGFMMPPSRKAGVMVESVDALIDKLKNEAKVL
ncbi:electron transfer flavoprotein subunit beta/FixA family protein [Myxococcota bacterium]|nr:electron transfer flavoprotein subunit beta/FixA family protein [Myxococcota bacterium]MBU1432964.1 electron transfer flavoprotein subunit beta/FixA family protein [Myxococcota bacterium]MBU1896318.1 electron transfer flavoprotein subunit beta/FixA family protein [Myxococcota bacterium]